MSNSGLISRSTPPGRHEFHATFATLILSIHVTGSPDHPRFIISDSNSKFWTGDDWTDTESGARLFVSVNDAAMAIHEIQLTKHGDKPLRQFVAPVYVDLFSDTDLTLGEIRDWLSKAARLTIDPEVHGIGPVEGTLDLLQIQWSQLREIKED